MNNEPIPNHTQFTPNTDTETLESHTKIAYQRDRLAAIFFFSSGAIYMRHILSTLTVLTVVDVAGMLGVAAWFYYQASKLWKHKEMSRWFRSYVWITFFLWLAILIFSFTLPASQGLVLGVHASAGILLGLYLILSGMITFKPSRYHLVKLTVLPLLVFATVGSLYITIFARVGIDEIMRNHKPGELPKTEVIDSIKSINHRMQNTNIALTPLLEKVFASKSDQEIGYALDTAVLLARDRGQSLTEAIDILSKYANSKEGREDPDSSLPLLHSYFNIQIAAGNEIDSMYREFHDFKSAKSASSKEEASKLLVLHVHKFLQLDSAQGVSRELIEHRLNK